MDILDATKKLKEVEKLIKEYNQLYALQKAMEKGKKVFEIDWDATYMENISTRMNNIKYKFDTLLVNNNFPMEENIVNTFDERKMIISFAKILNEKLGLSPQINVEEQTHIIINKIRESLLLIA